MNKPTNGKGYSGFKVVHTLEETAQHFGLTAAAIQKIERRSLAKLRAKLMEMGITSLDDAMSIN